MPSDREGLYSKSKPDGTIDGAAAFAMAIGHSLVNEVAVSVDERAGALPDGLLFV